MSAFNLGWTIHGKRAHIAWHRIDRRFYTPSDCPLTSFLDQTVYTEVKVSEFVYRKEPTGALVPQDLTPCKHCFALIENDKPGEAERIVGASR